MLRNPILSLIFVFCGLAGLLAAHSALAAAPTTVRGVVTDRTNNQPLAGAFVRVEAAPNTLVTGADGRYYFPGIMISGSGCPFTVFKNGYALYNLNESPILEGQDNIIDVDLYIGAVIFGTIVSRGPPVTALQGVTITADLADSDHASWEAVYSQPDGSYQVRQPPGIVRIEVFDQNHAGPIIKMQNVDDQQTYEMNFGLYLGGFISGQVFYRDTTATVAGAELRATRSESESGYPFSVTHTAADGTYTLSCVYPDNADIEVMAPLGWANGYRIFVPVVDQQLTPNIDFHLFDGGQLTGAVTNHLGTPVENVSLTLAPASGNTAQQRSANTDMSGVYWMNGLAVGEYSLQVKPLQGLNLQIEQVSGIEIAANTTTSRFFTLQPGGTIEGTVWGIDGNTLAGAFVRGGLDLQYPFEKLIETQADELGQYQMDGLSPYQNYTIDIIPPPGNTLHAVAVSRSITSAEGQVNRLDFTLPLGGGRKGQITDAGGVPVIEGRTIAMNPEVGTGKGFFDGTYTQLNIPVGDYMFVAMPFLTSTSSQETISYYHVSPGVIDNYSIQLSAGANLSGTIYFREANGTTRPAAGVAVNARDRFHILGSMSDFNKEGFTDDTGAYQIADLAPGTYQVIVLPHLEETNGWAAQKIDLTLAGGGNYQQNFYLSQTGNKVFGTARDQFGNRILNGLVYFWRSNGFQATTGTDYWGNYAVMLPPGSYQAQACYTSLLGTNLAADPISEVVVSAGFTQRQDFVMQPGGTVSGRVTDQLGNPVSLSLVAVYQENGYLPVRYGLSNSIGAYAVMGLHTGTYRVQASATGYSTAFRSAGIALGSAALDIDLVLVAQTSIAGTITGQSNRPVQEASVQALDQGTGQEILRVDIRGTAYVLQPLSGGPFQVKATAVGFKTKTISNLFPGDRADFVLDPLIGKGEAISYPNPARGSQITFLFWLEEDATALIRVYNQIGELVWDWEGPAWGRQYNRRRWQVSGVAPGVYLFKVTARKADGTVENFPAGKLTVIK